MSAAECHYLNCKISLDAVSIKRICLPPVNFFKKIKITLNKIVFVKCNVIFRVGFTVSGHVFVLFSIKAEQHHQNMSIILKERRFNTNLRKYSFTR